MHRGVGRRNIIWSLLWIALLGPSALGQGDASILRDTDASRVGIEARGPATGLGMLPDEFTPLAAVPGRGYPEFE